MFRFTILDEMRLLIFGVFACAILASGTEALECYTCQNVSDSASCTTTTECASQQACFHQTTQTSPGILHDMGCRDKSSCSNTGASPGLVGRSTEKRQQQGCNMCCSINLCNSNLCSQRKPSDCVDETTFDCARADTLFHMCKDVEHAKTICPRYCNLCDVVDGNWSAWSTWSSCDVTCSNGSRSRDRSCTNPAPANGGSNCIGQSRETTTCTLESCPVNGGWALWSSWGYCSVSCGVGMQRRDRSCSSPYPDKHGAPCYGDSRDDRVCMDQPCATGIWSSWASWESCSVSCGGGLTSRHRQCNNPTPSTYGHACVGNAEQSSLCNMNRCHDGIWSNWASWESCSVSCGGGFRSRHRQCNNPTPSTFGHSCMGNSEHYSLCSQIPCHDGGWSAWQSWESCSVTCGVGMRHRTRLCNNPAPSPFGHVCQGESKDSELCNSAKCHDIVPSFAVTRPKSYTGGKLTWRIQTLVQGISYNSATGVFTCTKPGIYYIYTNLIKPFSSSAISYTRCYLYKNSGSIQDILVDSYNDATHNDFGSEMATNAKLVHLSVGDTVYLGLCTDPSTTMDYRSTFTGFLLDPDN